jgi:transcriptional regulator with XRE-family HTH domain
MKEIVSLEQKNRYAIAARIAGLREQAGYMSKEMAQKMDISASAYSDIECANTRLSVDNIYKICQIFEVSADYIIFGETEDAYIAEIRNILGKQRPGMADKIVAGLKVMLG